MTSLQPKSEIEQVKAGVAVVIRRNKQVLIGKRKGSHGAGLYAFPGGHIDPTDNTIADCAEREVLEETGLKVSFCPFDKGRLDIFTTFDILGSGKRYVTLYVLADYTCGEAKLLEPNKCEEWIWTDLDAIYRMVSDSKEAITWIPIHQLLYYRHQMGL